jgi:hypothetical protein
VGPGGSDQKSITVTVVKPGTIEVNPQA